MTVPVRAVLFDMDGLMLDTERLAERVTVQVVAEMGRTLSHETYLTFVGADWQTCSGLMTAAFGEDFELEAYRTRYNELEHALITHEGVPVKAGLLPLLDWLDAIDVPYAVATSTAAKMAELRLTRAGIHHRFRAVTTRAEVARGKPAPDIYELAAKKLALPVQTCWVLEDSHVGVRAAHAAGMRAIMVPDLLPVTTEMEAIAHRIFPDLTRAHEYLRSVVAGI